MDVLDTGLVAAFTAALARDRGAGRALVARVLNAAGVPPAGGLPVDTAGHTGGACNGATACNTGAAVYLAAPSRRCPPAVAVPSGGYTST